MMELFLFSAGSLVIGLGAGFGLALLWNVWVGSLREAHWTSARERTDLDMSGACWVEVQWDETSRRVWINTERGLVGRIYDVGKFVYKPINVGKQT